MIRAGHEPLHLSADDTILGDGMPAWMPCAPKIFTFFFSACFEALPLMSRFSRAANSWARGYFLLLATARPPRAQALFYFWADFFAFLTISNFFHADIASLFYFDICGQGGLLDYLASHQQFYAGDATRRRFGAARCFARPASR